MFKSKSYNVKKASEKNKNEEPKSSSASGSITLQKKEKIKSANNKESPEYRQKIYPKKNVTEWKKNDTYAPKNETKKTVIPNPHKKLERK